MYMRLATTTSRSVRTLVTGLVLATGLSAVPGITRAEPEPTPPRIEGRRLSEHIRILSADAFEGREPGAAGEVKTIAYVTEQFKKLGLQPAGDHGGWTQAVPLRRFEMTGDIKLGFTLAGNPRPLTLLEDIVVHTKIPTDHVTVKSAPLVFIGFGVDAPERHWDDFKGYDLKGKIAVVLINDPDFEMDPSDPLYGRFDGKTMTYYGRWTYKYAEVAKRGALGLLIVHESGPAGYGWNVLKSSDSVPQFDIVRPDASALYPLVGGWIQRAVAVELFKAAGLDFDAEKRHAQSESFRPVELKGTSFSAAYAVRTSTVTSHNIIGKLAGAERPDEAVLYSAHWDHLGIGPPDARGDRIYNGAIDNASGVGGLLELARVFVASPRVARSVYFIAFTAEEKGELGADYYATHPVVPLARTAVLLNIDVLNLAGPSRNVSSEGSGGSDLDDLLALEARKKGRVFTPNPHVEQGRFFRSDAFSLAKVGVPAITFAAGRDLAKGGLAAGEAWWDNFRLNVYHQPADEWRPDWDMRGCEMDLTVYVDLGRDLARARDWPIWRTPSVFKTVRDQTAGARE
jgi:Zn-dependent M28 family amino/carboxypeptidase